MSDEFIGLLLTIKTCFVLLCIVLKDQGRVGKEATIASFFEFIVRFIVLLRVKSIAQIDSRI
jgi:hypothetical protein